MRPATIARNYAEVLLELGERSGQTERFAELIDAVAAAVATTPRVEAVLMSPRVPKPEKARILGEALQGAPREFVRFTQAVVRRGRHALFREIAQEYLALLDLKLNRVRVGVTLAKEPSEEVRREIQERLSRQLGKQAIPSFGVEPAILGGAIVRFGERIYDGSVRRRLTRLRRQLLNR